MSEPEGTPSSVRWARLRYSVVSSLLMSPPEHGELQERIAALAARKWTHPSTGEPAVFDFKTIERWYYVTRAHADPLTALARKVPKHAGSHPSISRDVATQLHAQYTAHPSWRYQLHYDELLAVARERPALGAIPGYATVRRWMKSQGLRRAKTRHDKRRASEGATKETRSYEVAHVHALWHLDFHEGSRAVVLPSGARMKPKLLGVLDDHSRLGCHVQWYLDETAEALAHGLWQAILKRGLPRRLLTDNGSAMRAAEVTQGLSRVGIVHELTLEYSPEQNGKQENFWSRIEERVMKMLEGEPALTLELLNRATIAWLEQEYHHRPHSEIGTTPLARYLDAPNVGRPSPSMEALVRAFRMQVQRVQRRSDGTITVEGVRFEVPSAYRTLRTVLVRVARWDLSRVELVDPRTEGHLATLYPLDKHANADARRRALAPVTSTPTPKPTGMATHLRQLMEQHAATGLPPGYLPKHELADANDDEGEKR